MVIPSPYLNPELWGQIKLTGYGFLPGYLTGVKGLIRAHEWVYQKGLGTSGASSIWRGRKIIEDIGIEIALPYDVDFVGLGLLLTAVAPPPNKEPPTFGVEHPMFALVGVTRIALKSYGVEPSEGNGWKLVFGVTEYAPTIIAKVGPADPAKLPGDPKPKDAIDQTIADLQATIARAGA